MLEIEEERRKLGEHFVKEGWTFDPRKFMDFLIKDNLVVEVSYIESEQLYMKPNIYVRQSNDPQRKYKQLLRYDLNLIPQVNRAIATARILGEV